MNMKGKHGYHGLPAVTGGGAAAGRIKYGLSAGKFFGFNALHRIGAMSDAEKGISGAHTPPRGGGVAAPGAGEGAADPAAAVTGALGAGPGGGELVRMLEAEAAPDGQRDLLGDMPDLMPEAARVRIATKRGRGRPPGAANRRSERMRDYLLRKGYLHPMEALAGLASSTPGELSAAVACGPLGAAA